MKDFLRGTLPKACLYLSHALYWTIFAVISLLTFFAVGDVVDISTSSIEELRKYPFGCETSYAYCARDTYLAFGLDNSYIGLMSLVCSFIFYKQKRLSWALLLIASPLLLQYLAYVLIGPSGRI